MDLNFRPLRADEIEVRVGSIGPKGVTLLLYKDARVDMKLLDEVVGPFNWKREHSRENANCTVSIYDDEKKEWVSKEDTGTQSFTEAEKGLASDSFKRACFNWGIGRELYSSPFTWVACPTRKKEMGHGYELVERNQFAGCYVKEIGYDDSRNIVTLVICNKSGDPIFSTHGDSVPVSTEESDENIKEELKTRIKQLAELKNMTIDQICEKGKVDSLDDMEVQRLKNVIDWLAGE